MIKQNQFDIKINGCGIITKHKYKIFYDSKNYQLFVSGYFVSGTCTSEIIKLNIPKMFTIDLNRFNHDHYFGAFTVCPNEERHYLDLPVKFFIKYYDEHTVCLADQSVSITNNSLYYYDFQLPIFNKDNYEQT